MTINLVSKPMSSSGGSHVYDNLCIIIIIVWKVGLLITIFSSHSSQEEDQSSPIEDVQQKLKLFHRLFGFHGTACLTNSGN